MRRAGEQLRYEQERIVAAKRLGIRRITQLDAQVNKELPPVEEDMEFDPLADLPWETEISDLGAVLDEVLATIQRFVAADDMYLGATAVWAAHTHLVHSELVTLLVTPRLLISAAAENSGKTTLLKSAKHLSARGLMFVNMTPASLFRVFDSMRPTLFIDEADNAFARGANPELLALINTGHERGSYVPRVEEIDGERVVVPFSVWGAIAMAAIGRLPVATTQSRCIVVPLQRAGAGEVPERLRPDTEADFTPIRRKLVRWAQDLTALPAPRKLPGLDNRIGDNWEGMVQIADLAGGRWPALIARAARQDAADSQGVGTLVPLLTDIREVFGAQDRLTTTELIEGLLGLEEPSEEWDRANRGWKITSVWLGRKLRGVLPEDAEARTARKWKVGKKTVRGYLIEQFDEAFRRYLPATGDSTTFADSVPSQDEMATTFKAELPQFHSTEPSNSSDDASRLPQFHSTEPGKSVAGGQWGPAGSLDSPPKTRRSDLHSFDGGRGGGSNVTFDSKCVVSEEAELTRRVSSERQDTDNADNIPENADSTDDSAQLPDRELW
jgi:putative DNA primase/helicase